ncbi:MAG: peptidyl-prolyl cis-trans isomerase, partial [Clostridiales bacterium]|nr:peptidyl-prolyl cis-trans isomerase [Clostridiales bacterium]
EDTFRLVMESWGFTEVSLLNYLREQMTIEMLYEEMTKEINEPDITPEEFYNSRPEEFRLEETRSVRHILVDEQWEAEGIIAELSNGADFGELVAEKSTDPGAVYNGGAYGPFDAYGRMSDGSGFIEEFVIASFALDEVGDVTQLPVASQFGYHIIVLDEIIPPHTIPFSEVRDMLAYQLLLEAREDYFDLFYRELMDLSEITFADEAQD